MPAPGNGAPLKYQHTIIHLKNNLASFIILFNNVTEYKVKLPSPAAPAMINV